MKRRLPKSPGGGFAFSFVVLCFFHSRSGRDQALDMRLQQREILLCGLGEKMAGFRHVAHVNLRGQILQRDCGKLRGSVPEVEILIEIRQINSDAEGVRISDDGHFRRAVADVNAAPRRRHGNALLREIARGLIHVIGDERILPQILERDGVLRRERSVVFYSGKIRGDGV